VRAVPGLDGDPGAQPQRTVLAWNRTVVATVLCALLVALTAERHEMSGVAAVAGVTALGILLVALRDLRRWQPVAAEPWRSILHAGTAVMVLAALGLTVAVHGLLS
jgi:hypothetical protein